MKLYRKVSIDRLLFVLNTINKRLIKNIHVTERKDGADITVGITEYSITGSDIELYKIYDSVRTNGLITYILFK